MNCGKRIVTMPRSSRLKSAHYIVKLMPRPRRLKTTRWSCTSLANELAQLLAPVQSDQTFPCQPLSNRRTLWVKDSASQVPSSPWTLRLQRCSHTIQALSTLSITLKRQKLYLLKASEPKVLTLEAREKVVWSDANRPAHVAHKEASDLINLEVQWFQEEFSS